MGGLASAQAAAQLLATTPVGTCQPTPEATVRTWETAKHALLHFGQDSRLGICCHEQGQAEQMTAELNGSLSIWKKTSLPCQIFRL